MPARFRDVLDEHLPAKVASQLVLVPWFGECVRVYPLGAWEAKVTAFEDRLGESDSFDAGDDEADLRRLLYGAAIDVQMDGHRRFVLPKYLREEIGIDREVLWVGTGPFLELWDPAALTARLSGDRAAELKRTLASLGRRRPDSAEGE